MSGKHTFAVLTIILLALLSAARATCTGAGKNQWPCSTMWLSKNW